MRVLPGPIRAPRGQALVELAFVAPLLLLAILTCLQLVLIAHARVRFEAALAAAARSYMAHGLGAEARAAAALTLAPASPTTGVAALRQAFNVGGKVVGAALDRFVYAYAHTQIQICAAATADDKAPLLIERGEPIRLTLSYDVALLLPFAGALLADGDRRERSQGASAALAATPLPVLAKPLLAKQLDKRFNRWSKRRLTGRTALLWSAARRKPESLALCVG